MLFGAAADVVTMPCVEGAVAAAGDYVDVEHCMNIWGLVPFNKLCISLGPRMRGEDIKEKG